MPKKRRVICLTILFSLISAFFAVDALAIVMKQTTEELTLKSDRIITGEVKEIKSEWNAGKTTIFTYVTVLVDQHVKGDTGKAEVTIKIPGGTVGDETIKVSDVARFKTGEKVLVFLENDDSSGLFRVKGWSQGKFTIKNDKITEKDISVGKFIGEIQNFIKKKNLDFNTPPKVITTPETKAKKGLLLPLKKQPGQFRLKESVSKEITKNSALRDAGSSIVAKAVGWQNIMTENFEGVFPSAGWTVLDLGYYPGNYYWGKDDYKPHSGSYSAWCARSGTNGLDPQTNNYPNYCESVAVYGPFDLSDATKADVSFNLWLQSEYSYDFIWFYVSIDGSNWYGVGYTGDSGDWVAITMDLTDVYTLGDVTGKPAVWIAAFFQSDNTITYKGAFIDDVVLRKYVSANPPVISNITPNSGSAGTGTSVTINGSKFGDVQGSSTVTFFYASGYPAIEANIISWSDTVIKCTVPVDASSGNVKVITADGPSNGVPFTVTFGYAEIKWYDENIPVSYYINENGTPDCANEFDAVQNAFKTWEDAPGTYMDFTYQGTTSITGDDHNDGYNVVSWGSTPEGAIAVTYIRYLDSEDKVLETDMIFSSSLPWSDSGETSKYDVQNIGTHEAGHFLVLSDLYGDADSEKTMYGFGTTGETKKRTLEPDDISGIIYIYPGSKLPMVTGDLDNNGQDEVIIDFGKDYGIRIRYNDSSWTQLHSISPQFMIVGDLDTDPRDDLIIDFGDPYGIWVYYNNSTWTQLHDLSPESMVTADLDGNGIDDLIINFGNPYGIWVYYNNSTWSKLHDLSPESMVKGNLHAGLKEDLIIDFGNPYGIWTYYNSTWTQLHSLSPKSMVVGNIDGDVNGIDDLIIDFGKDYGIWTYYNNSTWSKLHDLSPKSMVVGNLDADPTKDLIIDFGNPYGIWIYYNNSTWTKLHELSPESMVTGNLDGADGDDIVIDFGDPYGIWTYYNNSTWSKLHDLSP